MKSIIMIFITTLYISNVYANNSDSTPLSFDGIVNIPPESKSIIKDSKIIYKQPTSILPNLSFKQIAYSVFYSFNINNIKQTTTSISQQFSETSPLSLGLKIRTAINRQWSMDAEAQFIKSTNVEQPLEYSFKLHTLYYPKKLTKIKILLGFEQQQVSALYSSINAITVKNNFLQIGGKYTTALFNKPNIITFIYSYSLLSTQTPPASQINSEKISLENNFFLSKKWYLRGDLSWISITNNTQIKINRLAIGAGYYF